MKKIGILGGIGWPSTIEYYRLICEASQTYRQGKGFSGIIPMPEISIESLNMHFTVNNRGSSEEGSWAAWDEYFKEAIRRLEVSGAELIVIASVTPHARLEEISKGIGTPIVSIYESIGSHCKDHGIKNILVLGTALTMKSPAFKRGVEKFGVNALHPQTEQLQHQVINVIERLYQNRTDGTASDIENLVRSCIPSDELDQTAVCLGCTELSLAFKGFCNSPTFEYQGISYINSSVVHSLSAFQRCVA